MKMQIIYLWIMLFAFAFISMWTATTFERKLKSLDARLENVENAN
jgi:hypothetical protein